MRLLIIEDEQALAEVIQDAFADEKYEADIAADGETGYYLGQSGIYDAIILDGMLPGMDGYEILDKWRNEKIFTPVIMLTARDGLEHKLKGLNLGADDYLTKPFEMEELLARVRVITRRQGKINLDILSFGDIRLNLESGVLVNVRKELTVGLGKREFQLIQMFMKNPGHIISREQIAEKLWGYDSEAEYNNVEVYISFTRRKLKFVESQVLIRAVRGMGYRMEAAND